MEVQFDEQVLALKGRYAREGVVFADVHGERFRVLVGGGELKESSGDLRAVVEPHGPREH